MGEVLTSSDEDDLLVPSLSHCQREFFSIGMELISTSANESDRHIKGSDLETEPSDYFGFSRQADDPLAHWCFSR